MAAMTKEQLEAARLDVAECEAENSDCPRTTRTKEEIIRDLIEAAYHTERGEHVGYDEQRMIRLITAAFTTATDEAVTAERERIRQAVIEDCGGERDSVFAAIELLNCNCLAAGNRTAIQYQDHHNECPVYTRTVAALRRHGRVSDGK